MEHTVQSSGTVDGNTGQRRMSDRSAWPRALQAKEMYAAFLQRLGEQYDTGKVFDGEFGAMMDVALVNDGPVTCAAAALIHPPPFLLARISLALLNLAFACLPLFRGCPREKGLMRCQALFDDRTALLPC